MRVKLTKKVVEAITPATPPIDETGKPKKAPDVILWDTEVPGFGVKVTPAGKRIYFVYYRTSSGQQRRPKVGDHGPLTVDQARQIARQWLAKAAAGEDVSQKRQNDRASGTVAELATRYLAEYAVPHKKPRSVQTDRANLDNHVIPIMGSMRVRDVTRQDIDRMKVAVREGKTARELKAKPRGRRIVRGGEGIANRVVALASKMFGCAQEWGLRDDNPATSIRKYKEHRKDRFLDEAEVGRLITQLDVADQAQVVSSKATAAIRVLLYTGMRYSEVMTLRWRDVDEGKNCFRLADSKTGSRVIPYGTQVVLALSALERGAPDKLLYEGAKEGSPLSLQRPWHQIRAAAEIDASATLHTLRHTFASWSVMGGLSLAQVGALLGHKSTQTTLRYADHAVEALRAYGEQTGEAMAAMAKASTKAED
ncbi:tyrosine-type recombinase/integrase [Devosia sp. XGJD_8]|uniref:tyrosine-type recombinase/integrase n=1 Tax=Devosia sp. XGJD_8 TaxID=3391187 RepID=UPI0039856363